MRTERSFVVSENLVADSVSRDAIADRFNHSCELIPQNRGPWPARPVKNLMKKGLAARQAQSLQFTVVA
jgi:hypothetical protein